MDRSTERTQARRAEPSSRAERIQALASNGPNGHLVGSVKHAIPNIRPIEDRGASSETTIRSRPNPCFLSGSACSSKTQRTRTRSWAYSVSLGKAGPQGLPILADEDLKGHEPLIIRPGAGCEFPCPSVVPQSRVAAGDVDAMRDHDIDPSALFQQPERVLEELKPLRASVRGSAMRLRQQDPEFSLLLVPGIGPVLVDLGIDLPPAVAN